MKINKQPPKEAELPGFVDEIASVSAPVDATREIAAVGKHVQVSVLAKAGGKHSYFIRVRSELRVIRSHTIRDWPPYDARSAPCDVTRPEGWT